MPPNWPIILLALGGGAFVALQAPANAMLGRAFGSPVNAALVSFLVGAGLLAIAATMLAVRPAGDDVRALPWYAWIGGACGASFVAISAYAAPRIGIGALLVFFTTGQLVQRSHSITSACSD